MQKKRQALFKHLNAWHLKLTYFTKKESEKSRGLLYQCRILLQRRHLVQTPQSKVLEEF